MSLYKRNDSPHWWVKISHSGRKVQRSTGTENKAQAQEYHDKLKVALWEQERLGIKARRSWKEAVIRWLAETSEKATHEEDIKKLRWLDPFLGSLMLDADHARCYRRDQGREAKDGKQVDGEPLLGVGQSHSAVGQETNGSGSTRRRR